MRQDESDPTCGSKHIWAQLGSIWVSSRQRGLRYLDAKKKTNRKKLWFGEDRGAHLSSDGMSNKTNRSGFCADGDGLQPDAYAHAGKIRL